MARFYCAGPLAAETSIDLPPDAARHAQVLRLQPGDAITLFNGGMAGGEYAARIERMGRGAVQARVLAHHAIEREARRAVTLAIGVPANERMDWLVEKATELGVAAIQPLMTERAVLRLDRGERAGKKLAHWRRIAIAACEQCGRNRLPLIHPALDFAPWLAQLGTVGEEEDERWLLSLDDEAAALAPGAGQRALVLSGPEGGFTVREQSAALAQGFRAATLGARVLRSETAALAALAALTLHR